MEETLARAILESMSEGVLALAEDGRILSANPAAYTLLGLVGTDLVGASLFETVRHHELHALARSVLADEEGWTHFEVFSPRERIVKARGVPCASGPRVVLVLQDVTENHRYDQLRREFVANVSHELKSPLTSIRSLTETLLDGALEDEGTNRRFVSLIEEDAIRLALLIDDLLILSQIESRAVPLRVSQVELAPLLSSVLAPLEVLIAQKNLEVRLDVSPELTISADPDRLRQVLSNLIDNAVKYNREGGLLGLGAQADEEGVVISVSDSGPGIPAADCQRVFERFYRVDKTRARELGGTGLGLSIVRHIVESHGGRVWVESEVGRGSTFLFTLPHEVPEEDSAEMVDWPSSGEAIGLGYLQQRLVVMAGLVEEAVGRAVQALIMRDGRLARRVLERDDAIDREELAIDEVCLRLLEEQRPEGADLRLITMAFKLNSDLERMGDLAVAIAHRTLEFLRAPLLRPLTDIPYMAERVQVMVRDSLDALVRRDAELARDVCRRDHEIDRLNHRVFRSMLASMADDASSVEQAVRLMLVARALERIADHATNVAEAVVYIAQGKSIKHLALPRQA